MLFNYTIIIYIYIYIYILRYNLQEGLAPLLFSKHTINTIAYMSHIILKKLSIVISCLHHLPDLFIKVTSRNTYLCLPIVQLDGWGPVSKNTFQHVFNMSVSDNYKHRKLLFKFLVQFMVVTSSKLYNPIMCFIFNWWF